MENISASIVDKDGMVDQISIDGLLDMIHQQQKELVNGRRKRTETPCKHAIAMMSHPS